MLLLYVIGHFNQTVLMRKRETENKRETEKEREIFFYPGGWWCSCVAAWDDPWPAPVTPAIYRKLRDRDNNTVYKKYIKNQNKPLWYKRIPNCWESFEKNQHSFNLQGIVKEITNGKFLSNFSTFLLKTEEKIWCSLQIIISTFHNYSKTITVK